MLWTISSTLAGADRDARFAYESSREPHGGVRARFRVKAVTYMRRGASAGTSRPRVQLSDPVAIWGQSRRLIVPIPLASARRERLAFAGDNGLM